MKNTTKTTTVVKTSKKELNALEAAHLAASAEFQAYRKLYNKQNSVQGGTKIAEIIVLHKDGKSNKEIVLAGYNKNTVNRQVNLYTKGLKKEKTIISQYL